MVVVSPRKELSDIMAKCNAEQYTLKSACATKSGVAAEFNVAVGARLVDTATGLDGFFLSCIPNGAHGAA